MKDKSNKDYENYNKNLKRTLKEERNDELKENYKLGKKYYEDLSNIKEK